MKKLLAIFISLLMVFSVMPMAMVSAAGTYTVATGEEFVTAMADTTGATITLTADIVVDSQIQLKSGGKAYSIDTQGYDITYTNADPESTDAMFKFTQTWSNTVTFTNNTEDPVVFTNNSLGTWATSVSNGNTMKFVGSGAFSFPQGLVGDKFAAEIGVNSATTAPVFTGDIIGEGVVVRHRNGIINGDANVGTFSGEATNASTKTVTEMTFNGDITATGSVTLRRNTLYTVNGNVVAGGSLTLYGVTIPAGKTVQGKNVSIKNQNATTGATVVNSDITATGMVYATAGTVNGKVTADKIVALGGTFASDVTVNSGDLFGGKYATDPATLTGVTVHADVTNDGTYYVLGTYTPVEIVSTGEKYASLAAAYNAAQEGDTIKLTGTLVHSSTGVLATIKKNDITIDLNGQTVTDFTDVVGNSDGRRFVEVAGTNVSKFTLTSSNGKGKIILNGCEGSANKQIIRISNGNATEGADVTIENFDLTVPSSGGEGNSGWRGFINVNGTAAAENNITIKNVKAVCDYTASTGNIGYAGFELGTKANYTIENCEVKGVWTTFAVQTAGSVVNVKDSTFGFQKMSCVTVSSASEVEFDNCVFEKATVNTGTAVIRVSGEGADVTIKNSDIYSGIEVTKAATVALENCTQDISVSTVVALSLTTGGQTVSLKDYDINYSVKQQVNNNYAAFTLTGADGANVVLDLENVTINEAYRVFRATNTYNEISISKLSFAKTSASATFSANGNANITIADGEGYYVDEALTEEYVEFAWKTTKGQTLYINSGTPAVDLPEYDVTIDGEVVATVEEGDTFELPALEVGKKYVGYEVGQVITVTGPVAITTETVSYDVTIDGQVVATVDHGATYTLPALEAGKYYVGYEGVSEVVVTEALELTTAFYTYTITVDGNVVATVEYGTEYTLPALEAGKYYVGEPATTFTVTENKEFTTAIYTYDITIDGNVVATVDHGTTYTLPTLPISKYYVGVTEKTFTVTSDLTFTTANKDAVDSLIVYDADANGKTGAYGMWGTGAIVTYADRKGLTFGQGSSYTGAGVSDANMFGSYADYADTAIGVRFWAAANSDETVNNIKVYIGSQNNYSDNYKNETFAGETATVPGTTWTQYTVLFNENVTAEEFATIKYIMFTVDGTGIKYYLDDVELLVSTDVDASCDITIDGTVVDTVEYNSVYTLPTPEAGKYYVETEEEKVVVNGDLAFTTAFYTYDITIDGQVVATVPYGSSYALPDLEAGKYYVGYEGVTSIVVTEDVEITTATYTYTITIDGQVVATVDYGTEYTLPQLEAGKYYVGEPATTFTVTEDKEFTTAVYTYDITIDGVKVATVAYGDTFVLPAAPDGKQYVDGYTAGEEFVVTSELAFTTEDIPFVAPVVAISMQKGAGVRFNEVTGMRYKATVDTAAVEGYIAEGYTVTMGTLISPADIIGSFDALTFEADENNYLDVVTTGYFNEETGTIAGTISNIREANWGRNYIARSYVKLEKDGEVYVSYATENDNTRSVKFLANAVIDNDALPANTAQVALIEKWAAAADWKK